MQFAFSHSDQDMTDNHLIELTHVRSGSRCKQDVAHRVNILVPKVDQLKCNRDEQEAILMLVNACNDYQAQILSLSYALVALLHYPTGNLANFSRTEVEREVLSASKEFEAIVRPQARDVPVGGPESNPEHCSPTGQTVAS
jgi:hypothetical protein